MEVDSKLIIKQEVFVAQLQSPLLRVKVPYQWRQHLCTLSPLQRVLLLCTLLLSFLILRTRSVWFFRLCHQFPSEVWLLRHLFLSKNTLTLALRLIHFLHTYWPAQFLLSKQNCLWALHLFQLQRFQSFFYIPLCLNVNCWLSWRHVFLLL